MRLTRSISTFILTCIVAMATMPTTACATDQVLADLNVAIQIAGQIGQAVGAVSPADAMIIAGLSATASAGLTAIKDAYDLYEKSGAATDLQKLQAALDAAKATYGEALKAAHVSNIATVAKVQAWANLIYTSLDAVLAAIGGQATANVKAMGRRNITLTITPQALKARWDSEVCKGESGCSGLVKTHKKTLGIF